MLQGFFSETIRRRPALLQAVLAFNGLLDTGSPPEAMHVPGVDANALWASFAARRLLKTGQKTGFWDFSDETRRLALLPFSVLDTLGTTFGVAVHAKELALTIDGGRSAALRRELGPDLYAYALERGQYQLGACASVFHGRDAALDLPLRSRLHGWQALKILSAVWPAELRASIAFPVFKGQASPPPKLTDRGKTALWFGMKKILLKEVAPEWAPCFN